MGETDAAPGYALQRACQQGNLSAVQSLVSQGCDLDYVSSDGCTGLWLAAEAGHTDIVAFLCSKGANVAVARSPGRATALFVAAQNGHASVVRLLLEFGADPESSRETGVTPLFIAAQQAKLEVLQLLLDSGVNPTVPNHQGVTPIMVAAYQGHVDCVQLLLEAGCNPHEVALGRNTLDWAEEGGFRKEVAQLVMQQTTHSFAGAGINEELTPWHAVYTSYRGGDTTHGEKRATHVPPSWATTRSKTRDIDRVQESSLTRRMYEPQYLQRRQRTPQAQHVAPQNFTSHTLRVQREKTAGSSLPTRATSVLSSCAPGSQLQQMIERESMENESFKTEVRNSMFQARRFRQSIEASQPVNVEETDARWNVWKRTLQERLL